MRRNILGFVFAAALLAALAVPVFGSGGTAEAHMPACNGLNVAHDQIHGSGTQGELSLHDLRAANGCVH